MPSKASALLNATALYAILNGSTDEADIDRAIRAVPDDKFRLMIQVAATLFLRLKKEAVRRGIWEDLTRSLRP